MTKIFLPILIFFLSTRAYASSMPEIALENRESLRFTMPEKDWKKISEKVYRFVNDRIADPVPQEKIQINFEETESCAGFVERNSARKIRISTKIRSHVDFQIILAHELTHIFRHYYQANEEYWLDEGLAKWMEWAYIGEFPKHYLTGLHEANTLILPKNSLDCNSGHLEYMSSYFLMLYLHNHFGGANFINHLAQSPLSGWDAVESTTQKLKQANTIGINSDYLNRQAILRHFAAALLLNDPYRANYALLQIDPSFQATPQQVLRVSASEASSLSCEKLAILDTKSNQRNFEICF